MWQVAIHTVTSVTTLLLLLALLENAARRSEEGAQDKINMIAEALATLMTSPAVEDRGLEEAANKLRQATGLEERHGTNRSSTRQRQGWHVTYVRITSTQAGPIYDGIADIVVSRYCPRHGCVVSVDRSSGRGSSMSCSTT